MLTMTLLRVIVLCVVIGHVAWNIDAIDQGFAPKWIYDIFCKGITGIVSLPWDCTGYLYCSGLSASWFKCNVGLYFDTTLSQPGCSPSNRDCRNTQAVAEQLCPTMASLKFPHPASCALYYDCSQTEVWSHVNMLVYENECPSPTMFDPELGQCREDSSSEPIACDNKPTSPADYKLAVLTEDCSGKPDGLYPKPGSPPFSPEYIECRGGALISSQVCLLNRIFDPVVRTCVTNIQGSLPTYCGANPNAVFPDYRSCARFYDCSQTSSFFRNSIYLAECEYSQLFDIGQLKCVIFDQMQTPCGSRFEPIDPCDYDVGQCIGRTHCIPCVAQCKGLADGPHPFPNLPDTRFHITCRGRRLINILKCPDAEIYNQEQKLCMPEAANRGDNTTTTPDDTCQCLDQITSMSEDLTVLQNLVQELTERPQLQAPFDCTMPPIPDNAVADIRYTTLYARFYYTCQNDFDHCYERVEKYITCPKENDWDTEAMGECHKSRWTWGFEDPIKLTCRLSADRGFHFIGRAVRDSFQAELDTDEHGQQLLLVVDMKASTLTVTEGDNVQVVDLDAEKLEGEMTWKVIANYPNFKIYLNGHLVMTIENTRRLHSRPVLTFNGGIHLEEIKFFSRGDPKNELLGKQPIRMNLALNKMATSSSNQDGSKPGAATDGSSLTLFESGSCWSSDPIQSGRQWWMVDLGKIFYVSRVVITTGECEGCAIGGFAVSVSKTPSGSALECGAYKYPIRPGGVHARTCADGTYGRYVKVLKGATGILAFCEFEVYGGLLKSTEWTHFSCPDPPLVEGASVSLSYTQNEAVATYTCEGSSVSCHGDNNVMRCSDERGWSNTPVKCFPTAVNVPKDLEGYYDIPLCRLTLGAGVEFWMTPQQDGLEIWLKSGEDLIYGLYQSTAEAGVFKILREGDPLVPEFPKIKAGQNYYVTITALTDDMLLEVNDGTDTYTHKFDISDYYVHGSPLVFSIQLMTANINRVIYNPQFMTGIIRAALEANIALDKKMMSRDSYHMESDVVVNGNPEGEWPFGSCYYSAVGLEDPWIMVDLGKQYFIREVKIDLNSMGKTTEGNLALAGTSEGEGASTANAHDGNPDTLWTSENGVTEPYWAITFDAETYVSSVAIRRPSSSPDEDVTGYTVLLINAEGGEETCFSMEDPMPSYGRFPCRKPTMAKQVKVSRQGKMELNEVEVYGALETKLHDITVTVHETQPPESKNSDPKLCATHVGDLAPDMKHTLTCAEGVWGRFVRVQMDKLEDMWDYLSICELEVYGDEVIKGVSWGPRDCPAPPLEPDSKVSVSWSADHAVAHYECLEGSVRCSGVSSVICDSGEGWRGQPGRCVKEGQIMTPTWFMDHVNSIEICPPRLGDAIVIHFTPKSERLRVTLNHRYLPSNELTILFYLSNDDFELKSELQEVVFAEGRQQLTRGKESRIIITFLTFAVQVDVDGAIYYVNVNFMFNAAEVFVQGGVVGKFSILRPTDKSIIHLDYKHALNVAGDTRASSYLETGGSTDTVYTFMPGVLVDGNADLNWVVGSCWSSEPGDLDPWWLADMGNFYFMTHLHISTLVDQPCTYPCAAKARNFIVKLFYDTNPQSGDSGEICVTHKGELPSGETSRVDCDKTVFGRFLRIEAPNRENNDDLFALCELEIYGGVVVANDNPRNLALFRPATANGQSSEQNAAKKANNGVDDFLELTYTCWITSTEAPFPQFWKVELDGLYYVTSVKITSRVKSCEYCDQSLQDFHVTGALTKFEEICYHYKDIFPPDHTELLKCKKPVLAKYVSVIIYEEKIYNQEMALCEVEVFGDRTTLVPGTTNIALKRPVKASSRKAPPEKAVDGIKNTDITMFCWVAEDTGGLSWFIVELDGHYLVSAVAITVPTCPTCGTLVQQFDISVSHYDDEKVMCIEIMRPLPEGTTTRLECRESLYGTKVFATFTAASSICELEVFGQKVINADWSPSSCPDPPPQDNGCVEVCYEADRAVATYTCNTNYTLCTGSHKLYCTGKGGWEGTPGHCLQTMLEVNSGPDTSLQEFPICFPRLGEGYDLWLIPRDQDDAPAEVVFMSVFGNTIGLKFAKGERRSIEETDNGMMMIVGSLDYDKMARVSVVVLSEEILILIDGILYHKSKNLQEGLYYVKANTDVIIKKIQPITRYIDRVKRVPYEGNFALMDSEELSLTRSAKSSTSSKLYLAFDGRLEQDSPQSKCWIAMPGQASQWIKVDFGYYYFVTELVLYHRLKEDCTICDKITHDFAIHVMPTNAIDEFSMLCAFYEGALPLGAVERVACNKDVWGRYLQISNTFLNTETESMTFCEIEVYGDKVVENVWTPFECPNPPMYPKMTVQVSYSENTAFAKYTCIEDHEVCTGEQMLECGDETGWQGTIEGTCMRTSGLLDYGDIMIPGEGETITIEFCNVKLGEGIELTIEAFTNGYIYYRASDTPLSINIGDPIEISAIVEGLSPPTLNPEGTLLAEGKGAVIRVIFLTNRFLILVNGKFYKYYPYFDEIPNLSAVGLKDIGFRGMKPIRRFMEGVVRRPYGKNLAEGKTATASLSAEDVDPGNAVDGDQSMSPYTKCWLPPVEQGDKDTWFKVDLVDYFFVTELKIFARETNDCTNCADRTHGFVIDVLPNTEEDSLTMRCAAYDAIIPDGTSRTILCKPDVWGRYVRLFRPAIAGRSKSDLLTFCEIEIYGDEVVDLGHGACPALPNVVGSQVALSGTVPPVNCPTNYETCSPLNACVDGVWSDPNPCQEYRWVYPAVRFFRLPCARALYEVKILATATSATTGFNVEFWKDGDITFSIGFEPATDEVTISTNYADTLDVLQTINGLPYTEGQDFELIIDFIPPANSYNVFVDKVELHSFRQISSVFADTVAISGSIRMTLVEMIGE